VADIWTAAERIAEHDGKSPIIFIDYLQLLAAPAGHERETDKRIVDLNMLALRQMARELNTCVVVISSLNRAAYNGTVSLESFKESGSVEYSSDVLLGLQPEKMEEKTEDKAEATAKRTAKQIMRDFKATEKRRCELCVLKNRNGGLPRYGVPLEYDALTNTFSEG
jgi:replicative DNA helicase